MAEYSGLFPFTLRVDDSGYHLTDGAIIPAIAPSGHISAVYTVNETLSANIPCDDTVPQSIEGTEILAVTFSASSATAKVRVIFEGYGVHTTSTSPLIAALFVDAEVNARRASVANPAAAGFTAPMALKYEFTPGDTASHTIRLRVGTNSGAMRMNGTASGRLFGGASAAALWVDEIG